MIYSDNKAVNRHVSTIVFESMNALPAQERLGYKSKINKTLGKNGDPREQSMLANYLYRSIIKSASATYGLDNLYGYAARTKGDITKMEDWGITEKCKDELDLIFEKSPAIEDRGNYEAANELLKMLLKEKKNFEYGFKYNIEMIQIMYCFLAESYYELLDICAMNYAKRKSEMYSPRPKHRLLGAQKDTIVLTNVNMILDMYKNGEWAKFMNQMKNAKVAASESFFFDGSDGNLKLAVESDDPFVILESEDFVDTIIDVGFKAFVGIGVVVTIFFAIRGLIAYFFRKANSHKNYLENQAKLLDTIVNTDKTLTPDEKDTILKKKADMEARAATIERKIFKADSEAKKDMQKEAENIAKVVSGKSPVTTAPGAASTATPSPDSSDDDFVIL